MYGDLLLYKYRDYIYKPFSNQLNSYRVRVSIVNNTYFSKRQERWEFLISCLKNQWGRKVGIEDKCTYGFRYRRDHDGCTNCGSFSLRKPSYQDAASPLTHFSTR